jgi:hypothetical protein
MRGVSAGRWARRVAERGRPRASDTPATTIDVLRTAIATTARRLRPGIGLAVFLGYLLISIAFWGRGVIRDPTGQCLCNGNDPTLFMWSLSWWPHAIGAGINPFITHAIYVPDGFNLTWATAVPAASLAVWPVTALAGPVAAWNVLMLGGPALAGLAAFCLCRELTGRFGPSLVGGYLFGFSSFMVAESLGHLHLTLNFLVPVALLLAVQRFRGDLSKRRFVGWLAAVLVIQLLFSTEATLMLVVMSCAGAVVCAVFFAPEARRVLARLLAEVVAAGAIAAAVLSPYLYYALTDVRHNSINPPDRFSGDALNLLIPTIVTRLGRETFAPVAALFVAPPAESGLYIGLPIAVLIYLYAVRAPASAAKRSLLAFAGVAVVLALGTRLQIAGQSTLRLPWGVATKLPLLNNVLPIRFALYLWLAVAVIVALWLALPTTGRASWGVAAMGVVCLVPNFGSPIWHSKLDDPPFFRDGGYRHVLRHDETILALPYGPFGFSMLWAAEAHIGVRLAGGYISPELPAGYANDPFVQAVYATGGTPPTNLASTLPGFLRRTGATRIVVSQALGAAWIAALEKLGYRGRTIGGVVVYPVAGDA